jgi:hypothetical protein
MTTGSPPYQYEKYGGNLFRTPVGPQAASPGELSLNEARRVRPAARDANIPNLGFTTINKRGASSPMAECALRAFPPYNSVRYSDIRYGLMGKSRRESGEPRAGARISAPRIPAVAGVIQLRTDLKSLSQRERLSGNSKTMSFRGAGTAREPGTHEHRPVKAGQSRCSWFPDPALQAVPE